MSPQKSFLQRILASDLDRLGIPYREEFYFAKEAMGREWRADFHILGSPILVEVDGGTFSGGRHVRGQGRENDAEKDWAMWKLGYLPMHVTSKQVQGAVAPGMESAAVEAILAAIDYWGEKTA